MGSQEEGLNRKKDFKKSSDDDIDLFLGRRESTRAVAADKDKDAKPVQASAKSDPPIKKEFTDEEHDEQIRAARVGRAQAEAYRDVALLRKKAHSFNHKAAKAFHKYKKNEAVAQKCSGRAVAYREKAEARRERAREYRLTEKEFEAELKGAATGKSDLSPESLKTKIAHMERKAAKQDEVAHKYEAKAASQTEKAAKFRTRAAKFLEQNKLEESEGRMYSRRADNLERAGP